MSDIEFVPGFMVKRPDNAPDYVIAKLSWPTDSLEQHINWLRLHASTGAQYINAEVKRSKAGKIYAALDTWKPEAKAEPKQAAPVDPNDDVPF